MSYGCNLYPQFWSLSCSKVVKPSLSVGCRLWLEPYAHFIFMSGLCHTDIMCFSTFYVASGTRESHSEHGRRFHRFLICSMMWVMIEACHWIHTHIRSLLYIYIVFQHLLLWLVVIWMQPQHMLSLTHTVVVVAEGDLVGSFLYHAVGYDWGTPSRSYS